MSFGVVRGLIRLAENFYRLMISVQYQSSLTPLIMPLISVPQRLSDRCGSKNTDQK